MRRPLFFPLVFGVVLASAGFVHAQDKTLPSVFDKKLPESLDDLRAIEAHVKKLVEKVTPCTVGLRIGGAQGSGVIINKEGYILTAGHVSGTPDQPCEIILHDGKKLKGITLGANNSIDSGMVKITEKADFAFAEMASSAGLKPGQWCLSLGHPGGYQVGRAPVVRLGRLIEATNKLLRSDCTLVGGDSGGPLFDMHGRIIGIHSRIGGSIASNIHVPVDTYRDTWDRLASSHVWGSQFPFFNFGKAADPWLGISSSPAAKMYKVASIAANSPAAKAGLKIDDVILKIDEEKIESVGDLTRYLVKKKPGAELALHIRRGDQEVVLTVVVGKHAD
jgi:serine protease Do